MLKKIVASGFLLALCLQHASAQGRIVRAPSFGISYVRNDFYTAQRIRSTSLSATIRDKQFLQASNMTNGVALNYFKGINPNIDFAFTLSGSSASEALPNKTFSEKKLFLEADAAANFKMLPDNYRFTPYLIAGVGGSRYRSYFGAFIPLGGGLKYTFKNAASIFVTLQYRVPVTEETSAYHFYSGIGISGVFGKKKVPPPPPPPPPPPDTDGDGIADNVDACPTVAGLAKYNGCPVPDTDKDGINDEQDKCPTVAGVAKYNGCPVPDTDNDGINDDDDKCPTVPGVARYQGCPVPDTDNDGINDEDDRCPTVPGTRANNGCPEVSKEVVAKMEYAAKRIFFVTASAKLSPKSNAALNEVVKLLNDDPNLKLSIEGHTDNVGKAEYNKTLSDKRANSVKTYLINKGVPESRLTAEGFGLEKPIADNKTAAGKAKNRRVELKLAY